MPKVATVYYEWPNTKQLSLISAFKFETDDELEATNMAKQKIVDSLVIRVTNNEEDK